MGKTSIEWTDESINPIVAELAGARGHYCEKVSPGCRNCYSSKFQPRFGMPQFQEQRNADVKMRLLPERLEQVLRRRKPTRFFWCDMTDMFGAWVPNEWIAACFGVMAATPQHTHQVLTKRADRLPKWFDWLDQPQDGDGGWPLHVQVLERFLAIAGIQVPIPSIEWPLPNVHLGVSCEDQKRADERIPHLLRTPAAVRWVSAEPLLGPIDFGTKGLGQGSDCPECGWGVRVDEDGCCAHCGESAMWYGLDWVVVGGESGQRARPCDVAWVRSIVEQCKAAKAPVFVKQLGGHPLHDKDDGNEWRRSSPIMKLGSRKGGDPAEWPEDLRVREFPR